MTRIILSGCNGKMGQVITRLVNENPDAEIVAGSDPYEGIKNTYPVYPAVTDIVESADAIIDFSNPAALDSLLDYATKTKTPVILCTTGYSEEQKIKIKEASAVTPVFHSANMSLGVNLVSELIKRAAAQLEGLFDIEIVEKHHNKKVDAPSGTALMLADAVNSALTEKAEYVYERQSKREKRTKNEIGLHAVRGGTIVGEHEVIFAGNDEIIEIKHTALSKEVFAVGAIKAAIYMNGKTEPGLYDMNCVINDAEA